MLSAAAWQVNKKDIAEKQEIDRQFAEMAFAEDLELVSFNWHLACALSDGCSPLKVGGVYRDPDAEGASNSEHCGKLRVLTQLLKIWKAKRSKILLFSTRTALLGATAAVI